MNTGYQNNKAQTMGKISLILAVNHLIRNTLV